MTIQNPEKSSAAYVTEIKKLFGAPPVLSSENAEAYNETMARFAETLKPTDAIELMIIKDLTDSNWEKLRYRRNQCVGIERHYNKRLELEAERAKVAAEKNQAAQRKALETRRQSAASSANATNELEQMHALESIVSDCTKEMEAISNRPAGEADHVLALQEGIEHHQRLDDLCDQATTNCYGALEQLERYRNGGIHYRGRVSDPIVDAEFTDAEMQPKQVEASIVPPAE